MVRGAWLVALLRPYTPLFAATVAATVVSSVLDGFTFVLLIPFLRSLFGEAALPAQGGSHVEAVLDRIAGPFLHAGAAETALRNVVIVLLVALVLKNVTAFASSYWSTVIQESVVRDLRARLFRHLQTLPLGYFQRTKAGQTVSRLINDTDQVKTAVTAALASLLQNAVANQPGPRGDRRRNDRDDPLGRHAPAAWGSRGAAARDADHLPRRRVASNDAGQVGIELPGRDGGRGGIGGARLRGARPARGRGRPARRDHGGVPRAVRVPARVVRLRRGSRGAARREPPGAAPAGGRGSGPDVGGEDDPRGPAAALLRADVGRNPHGRRADHAVHAALAARADGHCGAGDGAPQRHRLRQRPLWASRLHPRAGARRGAGRKRRRLHRAAPPGLRHCPRRARHAALRRPAPAHRDRARRAARPADPHPRRGHQPARHRVG